MTATLLGRVKLEHYCVFYSGATKMTDKMHCCTRSVW